MPKKSPLTKKELFELLREQIRHEDDLVNQRLNWLLLSQAFLFAGLTSVVTSDTLDPVLKIWVPFGIAVVGALFSIFSFVGLRAAYRSLRNLRETWYVINGKETEEGLQNGFPKLTWTGKPSEKAITTATSTPFIILTIWWIVALFSFPLPSMQARLIGIVVLTLLYIWRISIMYTVTRHS